jgi:hypothetical protein
VSGWRKYAPTPRVTNMTHLAFTVGMIDVDRMTPTGPSGKRLGARAVIVLVYLILFAGWMGWRWLLR